MAIRIAGLSSFSAVNAAAAGALSAKAVRTIESPEERGRIMPLGWRYSMERGLPLRATTSSRLLERRARALGLWRHEAHDLAFRAMHGA